MTLHSFSPTPLPTPSSPAGCQTSSLTHKLSDNDGVRVSLNDVWMQLIERGTQVRRPPIKIGDYDHLPLKIDSLLRTVRDMNRVVE